MKLGIKEIERWNILNVPKKERVNYSMKQKVY